MHQNMKSDEGFLIVDQWFGLDTVEPEGAFAFVLEFVVFQERKNL